MTPRRQRMVLIALLVLGVSAATALAVNAFRQNLLFFHTPSEVAAGEVTKARTIRVGGLVSEGSFTRMADELTVRFALTDGAHEVQVAYTGVLPDLFREGQGVVAKGRLQPDGSLRAEEVLAKHDENYMPPEVADALESARKAANGKPLEMPDDHRYSQ